MSATARNQVFSATHTVGGLIPSDMLERISKGKDVPGSGPADYGIVGARSVRDEAERHWDHLKGVWRELRTKLPLAPGAELPSDPTGLAQSQWLEPLFNELGFGRLRRVGAAGIASDDGSKTFAVTHRWEHVPVHMESWQFSLDKHPGSVPAQSLVQECLNRTDAHLWAVLSNGRQLRLLRDSSALAGAAYVEFDLEAIFDGELFSEFVLLYRLLHVSRFDVDEGSAASTCWLEKWRTEAIRSGTRALDQLRLGVQKAITTLGTGFLRHPANRDLRENLDVEAFHAGLLRLAYRLLFLFVAEDRDALHAPGATEAAKERYAKYFSSARLRRHAQRRRGTTHADLYQALGVVLGGLGEEAGRPELGLPGLGGLYDDTKADEVLHGLSLSNEYLLTAVRALSVIRDPSAKRNRVIDYRHLDAEELGSIYESLLELVPKHDAGERSFELVELAGNARKTTGSYYTPSSLIDCLLDSALDPVIDDAVKRGEVRASDAGQPDASDAIVGELLGLTVCDPACGSGHFLVAAARRIAKRVAAVRERNPEPTLGAVRAALHEVVARCIYGVDLNPMAVELAKVSLWLEALEPGKPLGFLDAHVKLGNSLMGATPALLEGGIPDDAFKPIEGDDRKFAAALRKINTQERAGQGDLFDIETDVKVANTVFASGLRRIISAPSDTLRDVRLQSSAYRKWEQSPEYLHALHVADAWCAAFVWKKTKDAPRAVTDGVFQSLQDPEAAGASSATNEEIARLAKQYTFFHWHLEFPEVFRVPAGVGDDVDPAVGWGGGFSCVLGNPPWDKVDFEDRKYFSSVESSIADTAGTARKKLIAEWMLNNPELADQYTSARRKVKSAFHFASSSGNFELCRKGLTVKGVNSLATDQLFVERFTSIASPEGRLGCIVPTAIATGASSQFLFKGLARRGGVAVLCDFENRGGKFFPGVHASYKFCLLSLAGRALRVPAAKLAFFLQDVEELNDPSRAFALSPEEIALINPNTGTLPIFRSRRDAELTAGVYQRVPVLWNKSDPQGNPWGLSFKRLFDMTDDSGFFRTREVLEAEGWSLLGNVFERDGERMLPLYEGRMGHQFNHRFAGSSDSRESTIGELKDGSFRVLPHYWVSCKEVQKRQGRLPFNCTSAMLAHRRVARNNDERTCIAAIIPWGAASYGWILTVGPSAERLALLLASFDSFIYDYSLRNSLDQPSLPQSTSEQVPVPAPLQLEPHGAFIARRVLELTFTAEDLTPFARDLGDAGMPYRWDEGRRQIIQAELDALFFHLYGVARDDVDYILETFPIVKRKDEAKYGSYRTKELILDLYDRMAAAGLTLENPLIDGVNFTSDLTPPPGHGPRHPARAEV